MIRVVTSAIFRIIRAYDDEKFKDTTIYISRDDRIFKYASNKLGRMIECFSRFPAGAVKSEDFWSTVCPPSVGFIIFRLRSVPVDHVVSDIYEWKRFEEGETVRRVFMVQMIELRRSEIKRYLWPFKRGEKERINSDIRVCSDSNAHAR